MEEPRRGASGKPGVRTGKLTSRAAREAFATAVFKRDGGCCVLCGDAAVDPHHILDRKLFADGGYELENGASVCEPCHLLCESTEVSCEDIRRAAGIGTTCLPPGFAPGKRYDKWGNELLAGGLRVAGPLADDDGCVRAMKRFRHELVRPDSLPIPDWVGYHAATPDAWSDWRLAISELVKAAAPGGPLEGWLFHGTSSVHSGAILDGGVEPCEVLRRDEGGQFFDLGSFWGTALTAAWYAQDEVHVRQAGRSDTLPVIIAAPLRHLESQGELIADEATFDFPDMVLLAMTSEEFHRRLDALGPEPSWRESLSLTGAIAALHSQALDPGCLLEVTSSSEATALIALGDEGGREPMAP